VTTKQLAEAMRPWHSVEATLEALQQLVSLGMVNYEVTTGHVTVPPSSIPSQAAPLTPGPAPLATAEDRLPSYPSLTA